MGLCSHETSSKGQSMGASTIVKIDHDKAEEIRRNPRAFGVLIVRAMLGGDHDSAWNELHAYGVEAIPEPHHTDGWNEVRGDQESPVVQA